MSIEELNANDGWPLRVELRQKVYDYVKKKKEDNPNWHPSTVWDEAQSEWMEAVDDLFQEIAEEYDQ